MTTTKLTSMLVIEDLNLQTNPKLIEDEDDELTDHVKFRLWLARQLALKKFYEKWG